MTPIEVDWLDMDFRTHKWCGARSGGATAQDMSGLLWPEEEKGRDGCGFQESRGDTARGSGDGRGSLGVRLRGLTMNITSRALALSVNAKTALQ